MSMTSCAGSIAKSFGPKCDDPLHGGYTGRAVVFDAANLTCVFDASPTNPLGKYRVTAITDLQDEDVTPVAAILNYGENPFTGSQTAATVENNYPEYMKTVQFFVPKRGGAAAKDIDALRKMRFVVVAEKEDLSYEVIGAIHPLKVNTDGVTRDEYANGGAWQITASTVEFTAETDFHPVADPGEREAFEDWFAAAPAV